jgi:hypothetical protein
MKTAASTILPVFVLGMLFASAFGRLGSTTATAAPGSAPVTIVNTPLPIIGTVTIVPSQPFAAKGSGVTQDTLFAADEFLVPADKRLIVETISIQAHVPLGDRASCGVSVEPAAGGEPTSHRFVMAPQGSLDSGSDLFVSNSSLRLYYAPEDELNWFCFRNGAGFVSFAWSISGYLVDA